MKLAAHGVEVAQACRLQVLPDECLQIWIYIRTSAFSFLLQCTLGLNALHSNPSDACNLQTFWVSLVVSPKVISTAVFFVAVLEFSSLGIGHALGFDSAAKAKTYMKHTYLRSNTKSASFL